MIDIQRTAFGHVRRASPGDIALARVIASATRPPTIWFNYPSDAAKRWSESALKTKYGFETAYADNEKTGVRIALQAKSS